MSREEEEFSSLYVFRRTKNEKRKQEEKGRKSYSLTIFLGGNFNIFPNNTIICTMLNINQKIIYILPNTTSSILKK
jgi:hypothetical protein